jgi:hypothetical protein
MSPHGVVSTRLDPSRTAGGHELRVLERWHWVSSKGLASEFARHLKNLHPVRYVGPSDNITVRRLNVDKRRRLQRWGFRALVGHRPKLQRDGERIEFPRSPPGWLIARAVDRVVMPHAKGHRVFIRDLHGHGARLGEADVMGLRRTSPANEAGMAGHKREVVSIANAALLRARERCWRVAICAAAW